jgi:hypothetical protein
MKELFKNIDDKSKDEAQNMSIFFDNNSWDEMETLLNEDDGKPSFDIPPTVSLKYRFFTKVNFGQDL